MDDVLFNRSDYLVRILILVGVLNDPWECSDKIQYAIFSTQTALSLDARQRREGPGQWPEAPEARSGRR
jgi:hypothetical protein